MNPLLLTDGYKTAQFVIVEYFGPYDSRIISIL
jgi:hypothetical protein